MVQHLEYKNILQFDLLSKYKSLFHFSTTKNGGVSSGNYESFNLSFNSGDEEENVSENRRRLREILAISEESVFIPYQTHGDKIIIIDSEVNNKSDEEKAKLFYGVDALITHQRNICIAVSTADCVPVLIFDPVKEVIASIHAGWRGTVNKIVLKTISVMQEKYACIPSDLIAAIGPSISQKYFEVGDEVVESFRNAGFSLKEIGSINSATQKMHIDLWEANKILLIEEGILLEKIEISGLCTYSNPDMFFSARRQTIRSGRMLTGAMLV